TSSATSPTTPANSLPGTNGVDTFIWYSFATMRTSAKFTAAALTATRSWPWATFGDGRSSTRTTSGDPWVWQTAARTVSGPCSRVIVAGLGQLGRLAHELEHDRPECLQLLVVAGALVALFEDDGELPLGHHHVVVEVVDLPAGDRG